MSIKKLLASLKPTPGQKQMIIAFIPSAATFGMAGVLSVIYFTDWRVVTNYIPLYNTKYPKEDSK